MKLLFTQLSIIAIGAMLLHSCNEQQRYSKLSKSEKSSTPASKDGLYIPGDQEAATREFLGIYRGSVTNQQGEKVKTIINLKEEAEVTITEQMNGNFYKKVGNYRLHNDTLDITFKRNDSVLRYLLKNKTLLRIPYKDTPLSPLEEKNVFTQVDPNDFERI
ncbi:MAG: hypothetical protein ACOYLG_02205 [Chitinophagaceae bacterium]|jgi:hypothetical protein